MDFEVLKKQIGKDIIQSLDNFDEIGNKAVLEKDNKKSGNRADTDGSVFDETNGKRRNTGSEGRNIFRSSKEGINQPFFR